MKDVMTYIGWWALAALVSGAVGFMMGAMIAQAL